MFPNGSDALQGEVRLSFKRTLVFNGDAASRCLNSEPTSHTIAEQDHGQMSERRTLPDPFTGVSKMTTMLSARDWAGSPLGSPDEWPASLCAIVSLMLNSRFPMFVAWGDDLSMLYNDAYAEILGDKHPSAIGEKFETVWPEIWSDISPLVERALEGEATWLENLPLRMNRRGYAEDTWFTFSYSPTRDDAGDIVGMFCACTETTGRIKAESELRDLNQSLELRVIERSAQLMKA